MLKAVCRSRCTRAPMAVLAVALLSLLSVASIAEAGAPAAVTVRVEGYTQTLIPPTQVVTTTTPVVKDGVPAHSCPGTSAIGALDLASGGRWEGPWNPEFNQYEVWGIDGESYSITKSPQGYYWNFWLNDKPSELGACGAELNPGDSVLFFPECYGRECGTPPNPLGVEAPADAEVGAPVTVRVTSYANATGAPSPAVGAEVVGGGEMAVTNSSGQATMTFSGSGRYALSVVGAREGPPAVRTETSVCVHYGDDGTCGTAAQPLPLNSPAPATVPSKPYTGPYAVVAKAAGVAEGRSYAPGGAPRVLAGEVTTHSSIASVSIRLRRGYGGRCWAYDGRRERFARIRCGREAGFFKVSGGASFSYLLPAALKPGRYVYDIEATDTAGNRTTLARGSSRIVFYVR